MVEKLSKASNSGARCRSPSKFTNFCNMRVRTIKTDFTENSPDDNMVEAASRACGSSATKFYTGNNRERRRGISAL